MKKIIAIFLSIFLILSITACNNKETSSNTSSIDVEYYAKLGSMPECEYTIGNDIETIKNDLEEHYNDKTEDHAVYDVIEGEETVLIDGGDFQYYYYKDKADKGISYIVNFEKAFGFDIGTVSVEIKDALKDFKYTEESFNDDNSFFVLGADSGKVIKYEFSSNTVSFVLVNDALYATALYKTDDWE
ncbi:MAG: hypothetical protein J6D52_07470 [Clostridia bacterium]|nr:hypothetical protein [Clostridia bacterium]